MLGRLIPARCTLFLIMSFKKPAASATGLDHIEIVAYQRSNEANTWRR